MGGAEAPLRSTTGRRILAAFAAVLALFGIALALPIPFTNYPFGLLLVLYAVALIERDGIALSIAWVASVAIVIALLTLSHAAVDAIRNLF